MNQTSSLSTSLQLAPSELYVADLQNMSAYYRELVGLQVLESSADSTTLGQNQTPIIKLIAKPKLAYASPKAAGLFHNAILFESRGELARTTGNLIVGLPQLFTGTGDHLVSEAFYFNDPEGNGLELYFDRPSEHWQWQNGHIVMDTLYIDPLKYIESNASEEATKSKKLGHVHLKVGDIGEARRFYVDLLGFDITAVMPGALFVSIGGYHHHLGLNTWMSNGAGARLPALGLSDVTITLSSGADVSSLSQRLESAGYEFQYLHGKVTVADPWLNTLTFSSDF
jgi:catechol 2,3-dioxygenase